MHRFVVALFLLTSGTAFAEPSLTVSCEDALFAKDSSHQRLVAAFGKQNVALVSEKNGPIGVEVKSVIFPLSLDGRADAASPAGAVRAEDALQGWALNARARSTDDPDALLAALAQAGVRAA
jgi:hypothetical protein